MYLCVRQQLKRLSKEDYLALRELCHVAKNLTNEAIYNVRQHYFKTQSYLNYYSNYKLLKTSENYRTLNSNMAQQILKEVDGSFKSFFGLLKLAKEGKYSKKIRLPHYLPKDGYTTLVIGFVRLNGNKLLLPYSKVFRKTHKNIEITVPPVLAGKTIKEIRIIPKANARFFEIQYTYEADCNQRNLDTNKALALDLGINNLVTAVSTDGSSFIVDGRRLKSINRWYNKEIARLQSIKDKQHLDKHQRTSRQDAITRNRNNKINDYMSKTARMVINYCIEHSIGNLVVGYNETFQRNSDLGKRNNQTFVNIPYGKLCTKLEYLCKLNGIVFIRQEESYTSKASFWDNDDIPVYSSGDPQNYEFSGRRIKRGIYQTSDGKPINADVNGALNILKKSSVVSLQGLYGRGAVDTPVRIRVA